MYVHVGLQVKSVIDVVTILFVYYNLVSIFIVVQSKKNQFIVNNYN